MKKQKAFSGLKNISKTTDDECENPRILFFTNFASKNLF